MEEEKSVCLFLYSNLGKESLMKKETDMAEVKSIAKMLLMTDVNETKFSPMVVQHPFTSIKCQDLMYKKYYIKMYN